MRLALVGVPNCGKTALFNRLTGSRQKVANYAGVTVERKEGSFVGPSTRTALSSAGPAGRLQPHADHARRSHHARLPARAARGRGAARTGGLRGGRHEPAPQPAAGARTARPRHADDRRAQHERPRRTAAASGSTGSVSSRNSACRWSRRWRSATAASGRCSSGSSRCRRPQRACRRRVARPDLREDPADAARGASHPAGGRLRGAGAPPRAAAARRARDAPDRRAR